MIVGFCNASQGCAREAREEGMIDVIIQELKVSETEWMHTNRKHLVERIERAISFDGEKEPFPGLTLFRSSKPRVPFQGVFEPAVCLIAQGSKEVLVGDSRCQFDPLHYLLVTLDLPYVSQVLEASTEQPFLGLRLSLSSSLVGSVLLEAGHTPPREPVDVRAIDVNVVDENLLDEDLDAASAASRVGYQDASHFNREYKSLFGVPPMRDVQRLREEAPAQASQ